MIITQAPLRISFFGGGTDFAEFYRRQDGLVLSSGIDKYVHVIVKERFDDLIYLNYSRKEIVTSVTDIQHDLVREAMRIAGVTHGVEITTLADVPSEGTGLGSSSSITVALLLALHTYQGHLCTAEALAQQACKIELDLLGKPIGKQDQYIAAFGNIYTFRFHGDESVTAERIRVVDDVKRRLNERLMLFYTNRTRSADTILSTQRANVSSRFETLRIMRDQALEGRRLLEGGRLEEFGALLHTAWECKRSLADGITDTEIDAMYAAARSKGVLGGKISGAGGGGFLLLYCPLERQQEVREVLHKYRELPFSLAKDGAKVVYNAQR
jgi:D-glycero-alpha-D-manno-heptose-7-phosphate kinase